MLTLISVAALLFGSEVKGAANPHGHVGCIDPQCDLVGVVKDAYENSRFVCDQYYLASPQLDLKEINGKLNSYQVTIHTLPHLECIRFFSVRSSLPYIQIGVRIELTKKITVLGPIVAKLLFHFRRSVFCFPYVYFLIDFHFCVWEMKGKRRKTLSTLENANRSKTEQMTSKNHFGWSGSTLSALTHYRPAMPSGNRKKYFRGSF